MKMRILRLLPFALAGLVLTGCVSGTPYAPAEGADGYGHGVAQIEENRFRVRFRGNSQTPAETVDLYLLHRAAEVTLENGFDWFQVVVRGPEPAERGEDRGSAAPSPARYRGRGGLRFRFGFFGGYPSPFFHRFYFGAPYFYPHHFHYPYRRYPARMPVEAHMEILSFSGRKPLDDPDAYDARAVIRETGPRIRRPPA